MDDVGIVIPAYRPDPERLVNYLASLEQDLSPAQLHVELDTPSDAVTSALAETSATVNAASRRRGKGAAINAGFDHLDTPILAFVDADGSTPPSSLADVLAPIRSGTADVSVGSRRHPDSTIRVHQSRVRRRLGDVFVRIAQLILPIRLHDYQCGAKAIRRDVWERLRSELVSTGFAWDIEFVTIADAVGARIVEVPIVWDDKPGSTVRLGGTTSAFGLALLRSWHRAGVIRGQRGHRLIGRLIGSTNPPDRGIESSAEGR